MGGCSDPSSAHHVVYMEKKLLQNEADEDDGGVGTRFERMASKYRASQDEQSSKKRELYRQQLANIWNVLVKLRS